MDHSFSSIRSVSFAQYSVCHGNECIGRVFTSPPFATKFSAGISIIALYIRWVIFSALSEIGTANQKEPRSQKASQKKYRRIIFPVRSAVVGGSLLLSSLISCCFSFYLLRTHLFHSILEYLPFPSSAPVWMLCLYVVSALQKILNSHDLHSYQPPFLPFFFQLSFFVVAVVVGTLVSVWNEFIIPARAYENFNAAACVCKQHRKNIFHTMQTTI